jgi:hypothetical protein
MHIDCQHDRPPSFWRLPPTRDESGDCPLSQSGSSLEAPNVMKRRSGNIRLQPTGKRAVFRQNRAIAARYHLSNTPDQRLEGCPGRIVGYAQHQMGAPASGDDIAGRRGDGEAMGEDRVFPVALLDD